MAHVSDLIAVDIEEYLRSHERKGLLRFITCGSVDDGKSTLIGRLLYESKMLFEDQLAALEADSRKVGTQGGELDFALLVDGLSAEREQGITIDVAYRFFSTDKRKFIVADTPGHEQYTRNMITGASTAEVAVVMIDARKGVLTQTRRHSYLVSLIGIRKIVLAINKLDMVDYARGVFDRIEAEYRAFAAQIGLTDIVCIPMSALRGDNITSRSERTPWYEGPTLMGHLEDIDIGDDVQGGPFRMPVQWVNRPNLDFRGFSGRIVGGKVSPGDRLRVLPSGKESRVARVVTQGGDLDVAVAGQSITITLEDEIDISRGDVLSGVEAPASVADEFEADIVWMSEEPLEPGRPYLVKIGARSASATLSAPSYKVNVNTLERGAAASLGLNEIGVCGVVLDRPIAFDPYALNRDMGGFILIDRLSNRTVGAGLLRSGTLRSPALPWPALSIDAPARASLMGHKAAVLWFTGADHGAASALAGLVEKKLHALGKHAYLVPAGRPGAPDDPARVGEAARLVADAGLIALVALPGVGRAARDAERPATGGAAFLEVLLEGSSEGASHEAPRDPEIRVGPRASPIEAAEAVAARLAELGLLAPLPGRGQRPACRAGACDRASAAAEVPALEVRAEDGGVERRARRLGEEIARREQRCPLVHLHPEPVDQGRCLASRQRLGDAGRGAHGRREQLRRRHGAERVRGEIPPRATGPVDVLEAPVAIGRGHDADEAAHPVSPGARQIAQGQVAADHGALEPVAEHDVQGVRQLVGLDADEAALDAGDDAMEPLSGPRRALAAERGAGERRQVAEELGGAAGLHLDEQRLALVEAHAPGLAHGLVALLAWQVLLVERVARLVEHAEQAAQEVLGVVPRGDAHVVGDTTAERVLARVEPAVGKIEAELPHQRLGERALLRYREGSCRQGLEGPAGLVLERALEQRRQEALELREHRVDLVGPAVWLVLVEQGVVRAQAEPRRLRVGHLSRQRQHLCERRQQRREIVVPPRRSPAHLAGRHRLGAGLDERRGNGRLVIPLAAHLSHVRPLPAVEPWLVCGRSEELAHRRVGQELVPEHPEGRELIGPGLGAPVGHHRGSVPVEQAGRVAEQVQPAPALVQLGVGGHGRRWRGGCHRPTLAERCGQ
jgi:bifunctional enzyme CysN/CysC